MLVNRETRGPEAAEGRMTAATTCRTCGTDRRGYDLDATDAHELLVKVSEQQNRSLSSVALTVTERLGVRAA